MRWVAKAALQRGFGAIPAGERVNYWMQRHVTKRRGSDEHFLYQAGETLRHFEAWRRSQPRVELGSAGLYEFGAGWDLITPLVFFGLGARRQTLVDIEVNIHLDEVNHSIGQYRRLREALSARAGVPMTKIDPGPVRSVDDLRRRFGLSYLAPCDARDTRLPAASVDFATSTNTLEHIPAPDIVSILTETRRLLTPSGLMSCLVDMQDHYSFFDPSISAFNFLKFSDPVWKLVNSPLHYQNRLQLSDYLRLVANAGFDLVEERIEPPSREDIDAVRHLSLAARFRRGGYSIEELATRSVHVVARPHSGDRYAESAA